MSDALRECPFCGRSKAQTHRINYRVVKWTVSCTGDYECPGLFMDKRFGSEEEAIAAWNTRTPTTDTGGNK